MSWAWSKEVGVGAWAVWVEMAPYLLFGFVVAGMLSVWLSAAWVQRHLGGGGWKASFRAALFGVPLPLCSCSVIPVAASLREQGASRGATAAFLMSTPQVGVNSLFVTWGLLGPLLTVVRAVVAFVSGLVCGTAVDALNHAPASEDPTRANPPVPEPSCGTTPPATGHRSPDAPPVPPAWRRALWHGFVTLPRSLAVPVLVGISISAVLGALLPPNYFAERLEPGLPAMLLMLVIGIPMYVCSTSSVPVALALIHAGVPEGAALVFLITGPATNAATLATLFRMLGSRATAVYLAVLAGTALLAGWALDALLLARKPDLVSCHMPHAGAELWKQLAGLALLVVLLVPIARRIRNAVRPKTA